MLPGAHPGDISATAVITTLELVASERNDYTLWMLETLKNSPSRFLVLQLEKEWEVENSEALAALIVKAVHDLDRLEKRRSFQDPRKIVSRPHIPALCSFAQARRGRVEGIARGRRLEAISRRLKRMYDHEQSKRKLEAFMNKPMKPVNPEWLHDFLKPLDRGRDNSGHKSTSSGGASG